MFLVGLRSIFALLHASGTLQRACHPMDVEASIEKAGECLRSELARGRATFCFPGAALNEPQPGHLDENALHVIHLNGIVDDGCDHVTFATSQYGRRLAERDRWYALLANELIERCFVFVGTRLDESPLWQHLEARDVRREIQQDGDTPRSFLVTTKLDRARRCLLEDFSVDWVCASAEDFAKKVLRDARG